MGKAKWMRWLRAGIGLAALIFVFSRINREEAIYSLATANPLWLGTAFALTGLAMVGVTAFRWQRLLLATRRAVALPHLAAYYLVGYFFNMILPGSIGGDIYRIVKLGSRIEARSAALASVFSERLMGLLALLPVGFVGLALTQKRFAGEKEFVLILTLFSLLIVSFPLWFRPAVFRLFRPVYERLFSVSLLREFRLWERGQRFYNAMSVYLNRPGILVAAFLISLVSRLIWVAAACFTGWAIGLDLPFTVYMTVLAVTELVRTVPISLGGIGIREGAFVVLLSPLGVNSGSAFMLSFLFYLMLLVLGVIGGSVYVALGWKSTDYVQSQERSGAFFKRDR